MVKLDKAALYARFAAGEGMNWAGLQAMAKELGCHPTTLLYHRREWERAGRPGCQATAEPAAPATAEPVTGPEGTRAEAEQADSQRLPEAEADAGAEPAEQVEEPAKSTPITSNADEQGGQPEGSTTPITTMAEALMAAGITVTSDTQTEPEPESEPARWPTVGEVYEGQVDKVERDYALVNLVGWMEPGRKRPLRGRILKRDLLRLGWCDDVSRYLAPGDLVYVRVLSIEPAAIPGARPKVVLSSKQAPPHPRERVPLEEAPPITVRGSEVAAEMEESKASGGPVNGPITLEVGPPGLILPDRDAAKAIAQEIEKGLERLERLATAKAKPQPDNDLGLCATCVHHLDKFCPYPDMLQETYQLTDEELPERHQGKRIVFGRRPVIECELYRGERAE